MTSVALAVAAIPEGLPIVITVVMSIGVSRMAKNKAIVKELPAVETLGSASVICSDKTGTLTQNKMTLTEVYLANQNSSFPASNVNDEQALQALKYGILCSNAGINVVDNQKVLIGDPTETSIIIAGENNHVNQQTINDLYPRVSEIPFDSNRKLMSTINMIDNQPILIVKGAFDELVKRCQPNKDYSATQQYVDQLSKNGIRVIGLAIKKLNNIPQQITSQNLENNLDLIGVLAMIDPIRPEAKQAINECKTAGIRTIMITGDHILTASNIARELGILNENQLALTGKEIDEMDDDEFLKILPKVSVYARVSPENKIRIVKG